MCVHYDLLRMAILNIYSFNVTKYQCITHKQDMGCKY